MTYTKQDIAAGIVLFQPDLDRLDNNIHQIQHQVDHLVLVDNNSNNIDIIANKYAGNPKISIIKNDQNYGIARALNQICQWALDQNYSWCITLDQDSCAYENMVDGFLQYESLNDSVGIIHPDRKDRNVQQDIAQFNQLYEEITDPHRVITSGCMTNLAIWNSIGGFFEELFIDYVDIEFNERLLRSGYRIIRSHNSVLLHELGHKTMHKFGNKTRIMTNHSAFRRYYMTRNSSFFYKKYRTKKEQLKLAKNLLRTMVFILLFEKDRIRKISAMIRGRIASIKFYAKYKDSFGSLKRV